MLFLFNDVVFDIADPCETVLEGTLPFDQNDLVSMSVGKAVKLVREAVFEEPWLHRTHPEHATQIAALIAWKTDEANAMLAVAPKSAESAREVQVRLAAVSLVTMHQLNELQEAERLSTHTANLAVWSQAPQRMRA